jgi:hypothetical protein
MLSHIKSFALGALVAVCFLVLDGHAQQIQVGTGVLCDTKAQAEHFVAFFNESKSNDAALQQVNDEANQTNACAIDTVAYVVVEEVGKVQSKDGLLSIVSILVVGAHVNGSWIQVQPVPQFTLLLIPGKDA